MPIPVKKTNSLKRSVADSDCGSGRNDPDVTHRHDGVGRTVVQRSTTSILNSISVDRQKPLGIRDQIHAGIADLIANGFLRKSAKLPSCRALARDLNVSINSVLGAYSKLMDDGAILSRQRSGYFVALDVNRMEPPRSAKDDINSPNIVERITRRRLPSTAGCISRPLDWPNYTYPFVCNQIASNKFPLSEWRECTRLAMNSRDLSRWTSDNEYLDSEAFLEQICTRLLPMRGISAQPENVLVTMGAQQAIFVIATLLRGFGRIVAMEDPGYTDARNIFEQTFDEVRYIPVDKEGLVVDRQLAGCDLVFVTPNRQLPTVLSMSARRRAELLEVADREDFLIIEDDYEGDMDFNPKSLPPLYSGHARGRVIYTSSLSKSLAPGLRLGYLVAQEELVREARAMRGMMIRHAPLILQHTASLFLSFGYHERLRSRLHETFGQRWSVASELINDLFPDFEVQQEFGSTNFFFRSRAGRKAARIAEIARDKGVVIEPSDPCFSIAPYGDTTFRLGLAAVNTNLIEPGLRELRQAIDTETLSVRET
ncbi:PLP-dependent aminotransferase family protein [Ruegeria sp.]|uniref:aminotransferase-like domain-containing protein n=1 Tax=Ruegeria sp. TaxID=1879320 RepID=UPI003AFFDFB5